MLYIWFIFVLELYICFFTIDLDMFQIELVSIILPWIEMFFQIWLLWNHTSTASFFTQKRGFIFFCKTVKITLLRRSHFYRWPNFFLHRPQIMVVFTVLANFLVQFHPRKKSVLCVKILFFFVIAGSFFQTVQIYPHKKTWYQKKNNNITSGTAFFAPIWHKTWLSSDAIV